MNKIWALSIILILTYSAPSYAFLSAIAKFFTSVTDNAASVISKQTDNITASLSRKTDDIVESTKPADDVTASTETNKLEIDPAKKLAEEVFGNCVENCGDLIGNEDEEQPNK